MSHHYSINTLLKIQDPNISFSDIPWEEKKYMVTMRSYSMLY